MTKVLKLTPAEARELLLCMWDINDGDGLTLLAARVLSKLEALCPEFDYKAEVERRNKEL